MKCQDGDAWTTTNAATHADEYENHLHFGIGAASGTLTELRCGLAALCSRRSSANAAKMIDRLCLFHTVATGGEIEVSAHGGMFQYCYFFSILFCVWCSFSIVARLIPEERLFVMVMARGLLTSRLADWRMDREPNAQFGINGKGHHHYPKRFAILKEQERGYQSSFQNVDARAWL